MTIKEKVNKLFFQHFSEFLNPEINNSKVGYYTTDEGYKQFQDQLLDLFTEEMLELVGEDETLRPEDSEKAKLFNKVTIERNYLKSLIRTKIKALKG